MRATAIASCLMAAWSFPAAAGVVVSDPFDGTSYDPSTWNDVDMLHSQLQWDCAAGSTVATSVSSGMVTFAGGGASPWDYGRALITGSTFPAPTGTDYYLFRADLSALTGTVGTGHQFLAGMGILDGPDANGYSMEGSVLHPYAADSGFTAELNYREGGARSMGNGGAPPVAGSGLLEFVLTPHSATFYCDGTPVHQYGPWPSGRYSEFRIAIYAAARVAGDTVTATFEEVSLTLVPEPTALLLILAGGLGLLHRKRR